tara:strand:- start:282 stop:425 length:144 start_codon:yes stop_codon:yes gene_type:complete
MVFPVSPEKEVSISLLQANTPSIQVFELQSRISANITDSGLNSGEFT